MASVMKDNEENQADVPDDDLLEGKSGGNSPSRGKNREKDEVRSLDSARRVGPPAPGFFTIYKKGQGYWTRMGTLLGVSLLLFLLAYTLYASVPDSFFAAGSTTGKQVGVGLAVGFLVIGGIIALRQMNKPTNVDFLIATDSEMKKVNWTSRKELIGSSKVVIIFMALIAFYLFLNDVIFGYLMYYMDVLKVKPFAG